MLGSEHPPIMLSYADTRAIFELFYPLAQIGLQAALSKLQEEGVDIDLSLLPSAASIGKHLRPAVTVVRRTDAGLEAVSRQTLPGGNFGSSAPVALAFLLPAVQSAREAARRSQSSNNLKQIALAVHNYHDTYKHLPPAFTADDDGRPLLSWRVHILPFVEGQRLYEQFHLDEPWDSEHNKKLIAQMPPVYLSPNGTGEPGKTNYLGVAGEHGIFPGKDPVAFRNILDGTANTVMIVEANNQSTVIWTKPEDFVPDPDDPLKRLRGLRPGGFNAGFVDGSVRFIPEAIAPETLNALFTRDGGERIDRSDLDSASRRRARTAQLARPGVSVSGHVTLDGQPVEGATVVFTPTEQGGRVAKGATDATGRFALKSSETGDGAKPGTYRVSVSKTDNTNKNEVRHFLPSTFADPATSPLAAEITQGTNQFDFDLRSD
jgi:prepilin-type processing-associated H-X9-DG protein